MFVASFGDACKERDKGRGGRRMSGKGISAYTMNLTEHEYEHMFFGGTGKGKGNGHSKGRRSSGKGKGRTPNPMGRDGRIVQCYTPGCGSTTHLKRDCPMAGGKNSGKGAFMSSAASSSVNYVDIVEALLFLMANAESSEDDPDYWVDVLERANSPKGGKGSYVPKAPFSAFPSKAPFPDLSRS